jgi:hypothetical protein
VVTINLNELGGYKQKIVDLFLENQDIVDLMLPSPIDGYDIDVQLLGSDTIKNPDGTLKFEGQLFPYFYTDGTNEKARTFVLVEDDAPKTSPDGIFKYINLFIYEFTHKTLIRLTSSEKIKYKQKGYLGTSRIDILATAIDNVLNKNTGFGLKELKLESAKIYKPPINEYYGRVLQYSAKCENTGGDICG